MATQSTTTPSPRAAPSRMHYGGYLLALGAAVALGVTTWRYFTPLSGITGTPGALTAMFGELALLVAGLAMAWLHAGGVRIAFIVLSWIGIALTAFAVALLHGWITLVALAVAFVGLILETFTPGRRHDI